MEQYIVRLSTKKLTYARMESVEDYGLIRPATLNTRLGKQNTDQPINQENAEDLLTTYLIQYMA